MQYVLSLNLHILCAIGVGKVLALYEDLVIHCSCTHPSHFTIYLYANKAVKTLT